MNGRILILCAGEHARWKSPAPKQLVRVANDEVLIARTVRQCKARFSGEDPLIISHLPALRSFSHHAILPLKRRWVTETLFTSAPLWGENWTIVLLGDVVYSDATINLIIDEREKHLYRFYGTLQEIYACSFTDKQLIFSILNQVTSFAEQDLCRGKLWDAYYALWKPGHLGSDKGRVECNEQDDIEHYHTVKDGTSDFDTIEQYSKWRRDYERGEIKI